MQTVVVTDGKYRASIAAVRTLGRAGLQVAVTQTRDDIRGEPPVFASRYAAETHWIDGSTSDAEYADRLLAFLSRHDHPVLFCVGAGTLGAVARRREEFARICDFLIAEPEVLDRLNDKAEVWAQCSALGIPVPAQYEGEPDRYPVVIKPHCGEKLGLTAADRYAVAETPEEYAAFMEKMRQYDPAPLVQEKLVGDGVGVSLLLGRDSQLISAICHRRVREYPISGGPSTCCESFYDEKMIEVAYRLLREFSFVGMAMVEFKAGRVLEVNPRVWGSFPLTDCTDSPFALNYVRAAAEEKVDYTPCDYRAGVRMRFLLNDTLAMFSCLVHGQFRAFGEGVADVFRAKEALSDREDPAPMRRYLRQNLFGK